MIRTLPLLVAASAVAGLVGTSMLVDGYESRAVSFENETGQTALVSLEVWRDTLLGDSQRIRSDAAKPVGPHATIHLADVPVEAGTYTFAVRVEHENDPGVEASETYRFSRVDDALDDWPDSRFEALQFIWGQHGLHSQKVHQA